MTSPGLDPTRKYLVPVARLDLAHEPDDVHLSLYEWNPRLGEWLTGLAICGRSVEQGRLPDGTQATCAKCLEAKPGYDKILAEQARAVAERAAEQDDGPGTAQAESPFGEVLRRAGVTRDAFDRAFDSLSVAPCPGYETAPNTCRCDCEGCRHHCAAHQDVAPTDGHSCGNCEGVDPGTCLANATRVRGAAKPSDQAFPASTEEAPPGGALRDTISDAVTEARRRHDGLDTHSDDIADAVLPVVQAELARVSALHADTERRLTDDLAAEVRKREAAETTAETFRHKAVRRGLRLARVTGVLDAVRDLNEILDGLDPKETP